MAIEDRIAQYSVGQLRLTRRRAEQALVDIEYDAEAELRARVAVDDSGFEESDIVGLAATAIDIAAAVGVDPMMVGNVLVETGITLVERRLSLALSAKELSNG